MSSKQFLKLGNLFLNPRYIKTINSTLDNNVPGFKIIVANTEQASFTPSGSFVWFNGNDTVCTDTIYNIDMDKDRDMYNAVKNFIGNE